MPLHSQPVSGPPRKHPAPSEPVRPRTKRRKCLNLLLDAEVWDYNDKEILDAAAEAWRSPVYDHYIPALERRFDEHGKPDKIVIRFACKYNSPDHSPPMRDRMRNCDSSRNLLISARASDIQRGVAVPSDDELSASELKYSEALHRSILAIRCSRDRRSFESVVDDLHRAEVELLRPGTKLPCAVTVSNDVKHIYQDASLDVARFLQRVPGVLHLAVDGWTCPRSESFLGVVVFWTVRNEIHRAILEFARLDQAHTGSYMAKRIADCLHRYGIDKKIMSICLDNASSNNTLVSWLQELIPSFQGPAACVRCFPHIVNLMAKAFISLFLAIVKQSGGTPVATGSAHASEADDIAQDPKDPVDPDKAEHDDRLVQSIVADALEVMAKAGVHVSADELASARQILLKVAGSARHVNDSPAFSNLFRDLVDQDKELKGNSRALTRRVATHWNTDRAALESHLHFKAQVQMLTGNTRLKLKKYALTDSQWDHAQEVWEALEVFQEPTDRFSQSGVPLVHEVLPEMITLAARLQDIRDDSLGLKLHPTTRVAAQAALQIYHKYMGALNESDVYIVSVVMCPTRKLKWFTDRGYEAAPMRARVVAAFARLFPSAAERSSEAVSNASSSSKTASRWTQRHSSLETPPPRIEDDTIEAYIDSPIVSSDVLAQYGGVLLYWNSYLARCPRVARMALNYLTAPASSVDAERAFSGGRLMVNHLQHGMSSQTFQAQMAVGSWYGTELLPTLERTAKIIEDWM